MDGRCPSAFLDRRLAPSLPHAPTPASTPTITVTTPRATSAPFLGSGATPHSPTLSAAPRRTPQHAHARPLFWEWREPTQPNSYSRASAHPSTRPRSPPFLGVARTHTAQLLQPRLGAPLNTPTLAPFFWERRNPMPVSRFEHRHTSARPNLLSRTIGSPSVKNQPTNQLSRRTGRFHKLEHAKALMCVRCVAYPLRACPTSFPRSDLSCRCCGAADETLEHVFFECEHSKPLRISDRFSPLFSHHPPSAAAGGDSTTTATTTATTTLRRFITQPSQYKLAAFIHACFQLWNADTPQPPHTS